MVSEVVQLSLCADYDLGGKIICFFSFLTDSGAHAVSSSFSAGGSFTRGWGMKLTTGLRLRISSKLYVQIQFLPHKTKLRGPIRERIIPTERPPLVGKVSANFYG
jgi:hypothetical protein